MNAILACNTVRTVHCALSSVQHRALFVATAFCDGFNTLRVIKLHLSTVSVSVPSIDGNFEPGSFRKVALKIVSLSIQLNADRS